jgi:hypothetical protein
MGTSELEWCEASPHVVPSNRCMNICCFDEDENDDGAAADNNNNNNNIL